MIFFLIESVFTIIRPRGPNANIVNILFCQNVYSPLAATGFAPAPEKWCSKEYGFISAAGRSLD